MTYKAQLSGYHPQIITAGRRINDGMAEWMSSECILEMAKRGILIANSRILIMGFTFKDNCPDIRNTKIISISLGDNHNDIEILNNSNYSGIIKNNTYKILNLKKNKNIFRSFTEAPYGWVEVLKKIIIKMERDYY